MRTRTSSTAEKLRDEIARLITTAGMVPGDQMPTEQALSEQMGYSRSTVREALKLLEQDGLVRAVQGRGRFVSALGSLRVERPVTKYESITEMLEGLGYAVTNVVLDVEEGAPSSAEAGALHLDSDDRVIRLTRLRCGDDIPLVFSTDTVPRHLLPGPVAHRDWSGSLTRALELQGTTPLWSVARISAAHLPEEPATRYALGAYDPWLLVTETSSTADGMPVIYAADYHRGSEIAFNVLRTGR